MIIMTLVRPGPENIGLRGKENEKRFPFRSWHKNLWGICAKNPSPRRGYQATPPPSCEPEVDGAGVHGGRRPSGARANNDTQALT